MQLQSDLQTALILYRDTSPLHENQLAQITLLTAAAEIHAMALVVDDFIPAE